MSDMERRDMRDMARRDRQMRDMARRDRQMEDMARRDRMRDMARSSRMNDGRNPYGSRGGYVDSARYDMAGRDYRYDNAKYDSGYHYADNTSRDYNSGMDYQSNGRYDGHYVPFEMRGNVDMGDYRAGNPMRDGHYYPMDYEGSEKLSEEDLKEWYETLCEEIPGQYKQLYKKEHIEQVAKQMNIEFEKFKPMELVVTTAMIATDYPKSVGFADINRNVAMAKEWLEDKDSNLKGGEKLSAYYDNVVKG
jgi:hypothetical protein